jgi:hypothetical protein
MEYIDLNPSLVPFYFNLSSVTTTQATEATREIAMRRRVDNNIVEFLAQWENSLLELVL